jgi:hypothetical protein
VVVLRQAGGDAFGDVRHVKDEQPADETARDRADAADHQTDEERYRQEEAEAVGRDELDDNRAERASDAGIERADAEGQRLVKRGVDAHRRGSDRVVADCLDCAARAAVH